MQTRIKKVVQLLKSERADALLVWNQEGSGQPVTSWLLGFTGTASVVLITRNTPSPRRLGTSPLKRGRGGGRHHLSCYLITDGRYTSQAKKEARGFQISITAGQMSALKIFEKLIRKNEVRKIIFDGSVTAHSVVEEVRQTTNTPPQSSPLKRGGSRKEIELISRKHILQELRVVKEKDEIQLLKKVATSACKAFARLLPELHAGMTEKGIAKRLEDLMFEEGAEGIAFPTIVASGKNGAFPHARPSDKKIKSGELVTIDFGARYKGYVSDMTRTIAIGKISPRLKEMYEAVREAQELGCTKAKAGMTGADIDAVCRDYLTKKGLGNYFTHSTGHGIGMEVHELPHISPTPPQSSPLKRGGGKKQTLSAGAVITCEPGVYIPNVGGVRIEDALVLTKNGNINLSESLSRELLIL